MSHKDIDKLYNDANIELDKVANYFLANKLTLNTDKTKFMTFLPKKGRKQLTNDKLTLNIGPDKLERVGTNCPHTSFKFLGLYIDDQLSWDDHIQHLRKKLSSSNYALSKVKNIFPTSICKLIYNSTFSPFISYGCLAWTKTKNKNLKLLQNLQKRAVRHIINSKRLSHSEPIFAKLGILKISDQITLESAKFVNEIRLGLQPVSISKMFQFLSTQDTRLTRQVTNNHLLIRKHSISPITQIAIIWNNLENGIRNLKSRITFSNTLKKQLISKYREEVTCRSSICPDCN